MSRTVSAQPGRGKRSSRQGLRRRMRSGQTLVIFALSFTVLLGMAGLAIDVGRAYDLYAQMQRAAEAGALAGVLYMPNYYNSIRPGDVDSAVSRASKEVVKNGYGSVFSPTAAACVPGAPISICPVTGKSNDLEVTVTQTLDLVLLSGLGVQPVTLSASAQADYLPPAQLGARLNYFGDKVECYDDSSDPDPTDTHSCQSSDNSSGHLQYFLASMDGPSELKEKGDPYVYCEEGPAYTAAPDGTTGYTTYNGATTNHPQYGDGITNHCGVPNPGVKQGNPDQQPPGYTGTVTGGTAHPGGYNYIVTVPSGVGNARIWVYNPSFIPCSVSCGSDVTDKFENNTLNSPYYMGPNSTGIAHFNGYYDAPPFYFTITYSLYHVNSLYDRSSDTLLGSVAYKPYDAMDDSPNSDLAAHGCSPGSQVYDPYWHGSGTTNSYNLPINSGGCISLTPGQPPSEQTPPAACWDQWCSLFTGLSDGATYRLVIEATGLMSSSSVPGQYSSDSTSGYGQHYYALKVCRSGNTTPISCSNGASFGNPGLQIAAWNDMDVYYVSNLGTSTPDPSNPSTSCVSAPSSTPYACVDLVCFPTAYAGRTLSVQIYDPGDGSSGHIFTGVAEAGVGTGDVTYPGLSSLTAMVDGDSLVEVHTSYAAFNGLWMTASITLPSTYTGNCKPNGTGWWQLVYASTDGNPSDSVAAKVSLAGSPVHLVTPG